MKAARRAAISFALVFAGAAAWWALRADRPPAPHADATAAASSAHEDDARAAYGAYLARAGHCAGCHTARGGAPYAGGRVIATPFGSVASANLTPDGATGLGRWSGADFRRALREGVSRDGRLLYPACPYPNFTLVSDEDADALWAFLRRIEPVAQAPRAHDLRFPMNTQAALGAWRALFFRAQRYEPDAQRSASWNRGAYLVQGLGHCSACHARRNAFGAGVDAAALDGASLPAPPWYAPSLAAPHEGSLARFAAPEALRLLRDGVSDAAGTSGPMAIVVRGSTQHLSDSDLRAMVEYLQSLPVPARPPRPRGAPAATSEEGLALYERHCADCHGRQGEGVRGIYPALAGNRALLMDPPANAVLAVLLGGFAPATAGNPRPFGMPPFATQLSDAQVAAVLSTVRASFGNAGSAVSAQDVGRYRGSGAP